MKVYNPDETYKTILVNDNMRVGHICEIMLAKNHQHGSIVHWQIYEEPGDFPGFERQVEDHEFAMDLQRQWPAAIVPSRIWFRPNRRKYIFTEDLVSSTFSLTITAFT
nr:hypothetical transcript [Hymenolepis microstoma]